MMPIPEDSSRLVSSTEVSGTARPNPTISLPVPRSSHRTPSPAEPATPHQPALRGPRIDRLLLTHCREGCISVSELTRLVPRGTLYRHVAKLLSEGSLIRKGRTYSTTTGELRRLIEAESAIDWTILQKIYPPLQAVPSAQHRAVIELIMGAIAARRAGLREDHHPAFVLFGHTLAWKTSLARFVCKMLGLSPATHLIDLATESGNSLWLRRDGRGEVAFEREIVTAPFLALDEYLEADPKVRHVIAHFLSGRVSVPFENAVLTIEPVCLVTMNARPNASLEERTTFRAHQLRRLVLCDVDRIPLPDLALLGDAPLQAAAQHEPLTVPPPRTDCHQYRPQIVRLVREVFTPEAQPFVDVEMILLLCAGMTGFIEDDERAIQQVFYDLALVMQTLGWVQPDWLAAVSGFSLHGTPTAAVPSPVHPVTSTPAHSDTIILRRSIMDERESVMPQFVLSEAQKAKLIWLAEQEGVPVDHALEVLIDYYKELGDQDLSDVHSVLRLSKELKVRELSARAVRRYLELMQELAAGNQTLDHLEAALEILPALEHAGLTPGSVPEADTIHLAARLTASGVTVAEVEQWLRRRQRRQRTAAASNTENVPHD